MSCARCCGLGFSRRVGGYRTAPVAHSISSVLEKLSFSSGERGDGHARRRGECGDDAAAAQKLQAWCARHNTNPAVSCVDGDASAIKRKKTCAGELSTWQGKACGGKKPPPPAVHRRGPRRQGLKDCLEKDAVGPPPRGGASVDETATQNAGRNAEAQRTWDGRHCRGTHEGTRGRSCAACGQRMGDYVHQMATSLSPPRKWQHFCAIF